MLLAKVILTGYIYTGHFRLHTTNLFSRMLVHPCKICKVLIVGRKVTTACDVTE